MTDAEDFDLSPKASLIFWLIVTVATFAAAGFCAGVLYAVY